MSTVFLSVDKPLPAGHYIQAHTMLKVKVEVAYPLVSVGYVSAKIEYPLTIEVSTYEIF